MQFNPLELRTSKVFILSRFQASPTRNAILYAVRLARAESNLRDWLVTLVCKSAVARNGGRPYIFPLGN